VAGALIGVTIRTLIPSASEEAIDLILAAVLGAAVATAFWQATPYN